MSLNEIVTPQPDIPHPASPSEAQPVVVWMGGWVSSLGCWESRLRAAFPGYEHRFVDTHAVLDAPVPPVSIVGSPGEARPIVAAWSLGSLRVHRWMAEGAWPVDVPVLSLCPVFRFVPVGSAGAFGTSILLRMEQKLGAEREAVLRDFWRRMPKAEAMPPEWEDAWLEGTRRYDDASVLRALQYLRLEVAEPGSLKSTPARWELIAGAQDRLASPAGWIEALPARAPHARAVVHPGGHIPFWECPALIAEALQRLAGTGDAA